MASQMFSTNETNATWLRLSKNDKNNNSNNSGKTREHRLIPISGTAADTKWLLGVAPAISGSHKFECSYLPCILFFDVIEYIKS